MAFNEQNTVAFYHSQTYDYDHYIKYIQLWSGETFLAETHFPPGTMGNIGSQVEVDFKIVPQKKLKLVAMAYCTKHGLWQSDSKEAKGRLGLIFHNSRFIHELFNDFGIFIFSKMTEIKELLQ